MTERALRLATLGSVELTGLEPSACLRLLTQPKRLALLVFLAARRAGEAVPRDRIMATFWPELPETRARANLRNAVYWLRDVLGDGVLITRGAAIAVSPHSMICDASLLLSAGSAEQRAPDADLLALHRGEFLDALHISGAPDFERWVDRMRAVLQARAAALAWRLSAAAESAGEWITAAHHARRAADLAVDVEGATQRVIQLLDRAGDRAAALGEYERLVTWLDAEFEIEPSPETVALVERIRERRVATATPRVAEDEWATERIGPRSIAVLPFEDLSRGPAQHLATGVREDVLTALSHIRGARVVSRTSVRPFAEHPPSSMREVRDLLGVDFVLQGSVQSSGDRIRIAVQLIDAERDAHVWAQTYDLRAADVFAIQTDVALRIARVLQAELSPREHRRLRQPPTTDLKAWQLYVKGRESWGLRDATGAERAASLFRRALELDSRFARAWAGLADASVLRAATGALSVSQELAEAKRAVAHAVACDPELGEAYATMGLIATFFEPDPAAAVRAYRRAVELSPGYATAHQWYGNWLCVYGDVDEGLAELAFAVDLDPLSPVLYDSMGIALHHVGRIDEAANRFSQALRLDPGFWRSHVSLALCHFARNRPDTAAAQLVDAWAGGAYGASAGEAREAADRLAAGRASALEYMLARARSRVKRMPAARVIEIVLLMMLGREDETIAALEAAREDGSAGLILIHAPLLDPLTSRRPFQTLMADIGLVLPRWRITGRATDFSVQRT